MVPLVPLDFNGLVCEAPSQDYTCCAIVIFLPFGTMTDIKLFNHVSVSRHKPALFGWFIGFGNHVICSLLDPYELTYLTDVCLLGTVTTCLKGKPFVLVSSVITEHRGRKCRHRFLKPFWLLPVTFSYNNKLIMWICLFTFYSVILMPVLLLTYL